MSNVPEIKIFIERIKSLETEKQGISDDIKDVYAEAKAAGHKPAIMRLALKELKLTAAERSDRDDTLASYLAAFGVDDDD